MGEFDWVCIALFPAMIVFEVLEDAQFPIVKKNVYYIAIIAMSMIFVSLDVKYLILLLFLLPIALLLIARKTKWTPYLFLLLFLITRLITISYEI